MKHIHATERHATRNGLVWSIERRFIVDHLFLISFRKRSGVNRKGEEIDTGASTFPRKDIGWKRQWIWIFPQRYRRKKPVDLDRPPKGNTSFDSRQKTFPPSIPSLRDMNKCKGKFYVRNRKLFSLDLILRASYQQYSESYR